MNDRDLCDNVECPLRSNCKRSIKDKEFPSQWYTHFIWEEEIFEFGVTQTCENQKKIIN